MLILPAIDLYEGQAVRLLKGDYAKKTVYSDSPVSVALDFNAQGASAIHIVDLEGAASGKTPNRETILKIKKESGLFCEVGGGIRDMETVKSYLDSGIDRVILGSAAVKDPAFLEEAVREYGQKIAVGVDLKDGKIAIHGWTETADTDVDSFFSRLQKIGVKTVICTDISRDGAMKGTNLGLYRDLSKRYSLDLIASGGVSSLEDVKELRKMDIYGAIIGKAYYTGAIDLKEALEAAL
jgi:phosphoribosylformimino-5-aminoimidazole carboxamide ribotide isomerase